ncbi:MAG: DUF3137 domain-containing protein [Bacteroidetes bacterium]|nr:MAG: DUF3137 domain-containing protein [Bacteroidota bacterium]
MRVYHDFRIFYNQNIHPELLNLEQRRRRLVRLLSLSAFLLTGVLIVQSYVQILVVTLLLLIPVGLWIAYLGFRVQVYFQEFKPRVVGLILDFIDNDINYGSFQYDAKGGISKDKFLSSKIFTHLDEYVAEDLITGQVREMPFELCELQVREFSDVRTRLDYVFRGVFLYGDFRRVDMQGGILLLPDAYRKYLSRSERAFHLIGGRRVRNHLLPEFETFFDTYATPNVRLREILSEDLQRAILRFRQRFQEANRDKEIYLSIIGDKLYIALTQDKDLLEPSLFRNTVSFEVVREFYEDINLLLEIVHEMDVLN